MNKVFLIGRLTKDIELRYTASQTAVAKFTLAVGRKKDKDHSDFIGCIAYGKTAEIMERYVRKGHRIGIVGHIQTGSYERNEQKIYTTDVIVDEMEFLEPKAKTETPEGFAQIEEDVPWR